MSQRAFKYLSNSVRPDPSTPLRTKGSVEGHGMGHFVRVRTGFDRLSPNGIYVSMV